MSDNYKWDIFLSHASEDKEDFVRPLATKLKENNIKAWYDEFEIQWGDSIRESIDEGLKKSKFAIIVLSKNYFKKSWTSNELNGYFTNDSIEARRILPIWYNVTKDDVANYSQILADRLGANPNEGIEGIIQKVKKRLNLDFTQSTIKSSPSQSIIQKEINWTTLGTYTIFRFGFLGIDQFWQAKLLEDITGNAHYKTISDIDYAVRKAAIAVCLYAKDNPTAFESGTDFITKSIGFVDDEFRKVHNFSGQTLAAFEKYRSLIILD
ncbi:MAG TPA: toll/interleukin-1 receptor domain-containing protein [Niastella sp.]